MNLLEKCKNCKLKECIECEYTWSDLKETIEHFQKENEKYISGELMTRNQAKHFEEINKKYYIHKDKIRELLEDYKKGVDCTYCNNTCSRYILCTNLQDLLKEE